jgi:predicted outer membrane repeat protein
MNRPSRRTSSRLILCGLLIAVLTFDSLVTLPAGAAVTAVRYVAPTGVDSGNCIAAPCRHIYFAIGRAAAGDTISVAAGTYFENLQIAKNITVRGAGPTATFIDGSNRGSVFYIYGSGVHVTLTGMTIQNGYLPSDINQYGGGIYYESDGQLFVSAANIISNTALGGGGIFSQGRLILSGVNVLNNRSTGAQGGGGLRISSGTADLVNVTVANNTASWLGGGIYNQGTTKLTNVTIANNSSSLSGGGLYNDKSTVTGTGGEIRNNRAEINGGGIYNASASAQLQLSATTIRDNSVAQGSGGGVFNDHGAANFSRVNLSGNRARGGGGGVFNSLGGQFTLSNTWLKDNIAQTAAGGGISNEGTLNLTASTLSGNTASQLQGGGLRNKGSATLTLITLSGNTTTNSQGGAIYADGGLVQLVSSTIVSNTDPGLKADAPGTLSLVNSIVVDRSGGPNCSGAITSQGYNLETKNSCNFNQPGDQVNKSSPGVGPLRNNGGPTPTQALAFSSPATNNGTTDPAKCQAMDQRGLTRPQPDNGRCDIGAYEIVGSENNTTMPIPANGCVTSAIAVNASYAIGTLNVGVNATFNPRGGLRVTLVSPAGKRVALLGPTGGTAVNLDALFDDAASSGVPGSGTNDTTSPYYDNIYRPYEPLAALHGVPIKGTWSLVACSVTSATGFLNSWLILVPEVSTNFKSYLPLIRR